MRLIEKEVFLPPVDGRSVFPGPVTYIDEGAGSLMMWYGFIDHSDAFDDYVEVVSTDNGETWSRPIPRFRGYSVDGGRVRYAEPTLAFHPPSKSLYGIIKRAFYPGDERVQSIVWELHIARYDFARSVWHEPVVTKLGYDEGIAVSFCFPITTSTGRLLTPAQKAIVDAEGNFVHYGEYWSRAYQATCIIGEADEPLERNPTGDPLGDPLGSPPHVLGRGSDGEARIVFRPGGLVPTDLEQSCRGQCEPTIVELSDGRIAAICRGDNGAFPDKPGFKWISISSDEGESFGPPVPLQCTDGGSVESASNGSAFFRSIHNNRLYWIGNLCVRGVRPDGNSPRSPLVVAEIDEERLGIIRESITIVDEVSGSDGPDTQLSNFKYYQDRSTGNVIVFLTRFGESGSRLAGANCYRYRIELS